MLTLRRQFFVLLFVSSLVLTNLSTANAMLSEAASLAITAAGGMLQEDDKKLEQDIIKGLSDDSQKQQLKSYVENTRPIIKEKSQFFSSVISPAFLWCMNTMPSVGNFLMGTVTSAYIMHYENQLEKNTDSDILKKFIELREHNIDAGQGMFETLMDANDPQYDKNTSNTTLITDGTLIAAKGMQNYNRYKSSAAAIATVLEAANIPMQPEDVGDICINQYVNSTNNKSVQLPPSEDATKSSKPKTSSQDNNKTESPPITQSAPPSPSPTNSIEHEAINVLHEFHKSITKKELRTAYDYMSQDMKGRVSYEGWAPGFKTTVHSEVYDVKIASQSENQTTLTYYLKAVDNPGGTRIFSGTAEMVKVGNTWKINRLTNKPKDP